MPSSFGAITFGPDETVELGSCGDLNRKTNVTCAHGAWRPPERLVPFLPPNFSIPIDCYTGGDGLRRFIPRCNFEELIDVGAVGGLAILQGIHACDKKVDYSYRAMRLIQRHVRGRASSGKRGMKGHFTREFEYSRDLYIRRPGRLADDERDVLPDDIGQTASGEGRRLSVTQLTEQGRQAAQEAGCLNPTSKDAIAYGLYETAQRNPLEVGAEKVPALIQAALFEMGPTEGGPSAELIDSVTSRALEAIYSHLSETQEAFDDWLSGPKSSFLKQLAKQKGKPGGKLSQEDVRRALLHLGWQAYEYIGPCVHALMRTIKNSISPPLNDEEKRLFEHMHESQPYYGGLPAAMLAERTGFLQLAILAIWNDPQNQDHVRVLHRLLQCYAEMVRRRRAADCQSKRRCQDQPQGPSSAAGCSDLGKNKDVGVAAETMIPEDEMPASELRAVGDVEFIENRDSARSSAADPFVEVADHIRELNHIECMSGCTAWEYQRDDNSQESVTILLRCECGRTQRKIHMSMGEFAHQAETVLQWRRRASNDIPPPATSAGEES